MSPRAGFNAAVRYRTPDGVMNAEAFAYMDALYVRGKIAYALHFGAAQNTHVIAPGFGLVPPTWMITEERMKKMRKTDVDMRDRTYVKTLRATSLQLAQEIDADTRIVLLGSVATGLYVDLLVLIFGERPRFLIEVAELGVI